MTPAAGAPPLALVVNLEGVNGPAPLHVIGWAPALIEASDGSTLTGQWEAVVALGDGYASRMSELEHHGVTEVHGLGPVPQPAHAGITPSGLSIPGVAAR